MAWRKWFKASTRIGFTPELHKELRSMRSGTIAELTHPDGDHYIIMLSEDYQRIIDKMERLSGISFLAKDLTL